MLLHSVLCELPNTEVWFEGRFVLPLEELSPIDVGEEWVRFDFGRSSFSSKAMIRLAIEKPHHCIPGSRRKAFRNLDGSGVNNFTTYLFGIFIKE